MNNNLPRTYETVSEAVNDLAKRGYDTNFSIHDENDCLYCVDNSMNLSPEEFEIDAVYRFECMNDPGDSMIVYAISSIKHNVKGVVVNAFGVYSDSTTSKIVKYLHRDL